MASWKNGASVILAVFGILSACCPQIVGEVESGVDGGLDGGDAGPPGVCALPSAPGAGFSAAGQLCEALSGCTNSPELLSAPCNALCTACSTADGPVLRAIGLDCAYECGVLELCIADAGTRLTAACDDGVRELQLAAWDAGWHR